MPAVRDSRAVRAGPANSALFLCQDPLAPCSRLGEGVSCPEVALEGRVQLWHCSSPAGSLFLVPPSGAVCSLLWHFSSVDTSLGVFPFIV